MIFVEKKGRFGNFLFQLFVAKCVQRINNHKIVVFSKNENIHYFNSKRNIDRIVDGFISLPKFSKFLNILKNKCFYINDSNYKEVLFLKNFKNRNFFYINGFFQDISIIESNKDLLDKILNKNEIKNFNYKRSDLTIHIRHLHHELGALDKNVDYQEQPKIDYYTKIINELNPETIKVICSNKNNINAIELKNIYKSRVFIESKDDINDFLNLVYSEKLILSNSTFSLWGSLLSKNKTIYVPHIGIIKKIFGKKKNLKLSNTFIYK